MVQNLHNLHSGWKGKQCQKGRHLDGRNLVGTCTLEVCSGSPRRNVELMGKNPLPNQSAKYKPKFLQLKGKQIAHLKSIVVCQCVLYVILGFG